MRILRTSRNAADCLFSTIPKGLRIGCFSLQIWLSHFGAKDGQLHCISTCLRAARYKYLPILKRKIWGKHANDGQLAFHFNVFAQKGEGDLRPFLPMYLGPAISFALAWFRICNYLHTSRPVCGHAEMPQERPGDKQPQWLFVRHKKNRTSRSCSQHRPGIRWPQNKQPG